MWKYCRKTLRFSHLSQGIFHGTLKIQHSLKYDNIKSSKYFNGSDLNAKVIRMKQKRCKIEDTQHICVHRCSVFDANNNKDNISNRDK